MSERTEHEGLHGTEGTVLDVARRRWTPGRIALQIVGIAIGLALLGWAVSMALSEENRQTLETVWAAPLRLVAAIAGLTLVSIVLNGLTFWVTLGPLRRLSLVDVVGINAIATFLSVLPFKLGFLMRVVYHHRRDRVPFRDIVAWFAAAGALGLAVLLPVGFASLWIGEPTIMWGIAAAGGALLCTAIGVGLSFAALRVRLLHRLSLGADRVIRDQRAVWSQWVLRMSEVCVLGARFYLAARIAGVDLGLARSLLLGAGYFIISVVAPAGSVGVAEMGTVGVARVASIDSEAIVVVALIVTVTQLGVSFLVSGPIWLYLRPERVLVPGRMNPISPPRSDESRSSTPGAA
ncbi:MAG: lysylphosphatidylglycerol synthase transmembrane domain-containing protein [Planctomycetota bacterium]